MDFHSPLKRSFHFLCFFLVSSFFHESYHVSSNPENFQNCKNDFSCGGSFTGIGYPFKGQDDPEYCGYPGLELRCYESNGDHITRIEIKNMTFRVVGIDRPTQTMRVAREDVMEAACPTDFVNTTLDFSLFDYATTIHFLNLTFLYGCPDSSLPGLNLNSLPSCGAGVYVLPGVVGPGRCNTSVVYPIAQTGNREPVNRVWSRFSGKALTLGGGWIAASAVNAAGLMVSAGTILLRIKQIATARNRLT